MNTVYLHGLNSSPEGTKGKLFRRLLGEDFSAPDLGPDLVSTSFKQKFELARAHLKERTLLVGSSLGGYIAALLAEQFPDKVGQLILIAPAFEYFKRQGIEEEYSDIPSVQCPTLVIAGRKDDIVPLSVIDEFVKKNETCDYVLLANGDHRMHDQEAMIENVTRQCIRNFKRI